MAKLTATDVRRMLMWMDQTDKALETIPSDVAYNGLVRLAIERVGETRKILLGAAIADVEVETVVPIRSVA